MRNDKLVSLNLQDAPVIVGLTALDADSQLDIKWPTKVRFAELNLPKKQINELSEQLQWLKRQYEALNKNPKTRVYAPHVLPYLALATLHINSYGKDFAAAATHNDYPLKYTNNLAKSLKESFKINPVSQTTSDGSGVEGALVSDRTRFRVIKQMPLNELEAGFRTFYQSSGLSYAAAYDAWLELDYDEKRKLMSDQLRAGQIEVSYELEVVLEPQLLLDGTRAGLFEILSVQKPTPAHGYSLPKKLSDGGMIERCFDISYELHSKLSKDYKNAAPLVCLWGHRQRAMVRTNISGLKNMAGTQKSRLRRLSNVLLDKLSEKHPLTIEEVRATENKR